MPDPVPETPLLDTLTHARLRVSQGDPEGARKILHGILASCPEHADARALLARIESAEPRLRAEEPEEEALAPPVPGDPRALRMRFGKRPPAADRLASWLLRVRTQHTRER